MEVALHYPGFKYSANDLLKYITILNDFTIMLKDGDIIKYIPDNDTAFKIWLKENNIQNIREEKGWIIDN